MQGKTTSRSAIQELRAIGISNLTEILPRLWHWQGANSLNSYVWQRANGCVLIDPTADITPSLLNSLDLGAVSSILITHVQEEHVAGCNNFPDVPVHVPLGDEYLCRGSESYRRCISTWQAPWDWETRGNYQGHLAGARNERPASMPLNLAETLHPGRPWQGCLVLATPGHGKNAVTVVATIDGRRIAFCGDLIHVGGTLWNWFDADWDYGPQGGARALLKSAGDLESCLMAQGADDARVLLCPAHGPVIEDPPSALRALQRQLLALLEPSESVAFNPASTSAPASPSKAAGFRQLLPHVHQYNETFGNCNILLSDSGHALMVDDGLCYWQPLEKRAQHHRRVIEQLKQSLGIQRIEIVIPTHYHGDHTENIPEIVAMEQARVVALDSVAEPMQYPERFNLCANLPWYGTRYKCVPVDQVVTSGARIKWREYELEIFHLAGQTYHHSGISVEVDDQRVLFAGDAVEGPACEPVLCYNDNEPETRGWAYAVERMLERQPDLLICGHALAFANPMPLLQVKRQLWQRQLERYRDLSARASLREFFDPFLKGQS